MINIQDIESFHKEFLDMKSGTLLVIFVRYDLESIIFEFNHYDLGVLEGKVHAHEKQIPDRYIGAYKSALHYTLIDSYRLFKERDIGLLINWRWMSNSFRREIYGI